MGEFQVRQKLGLVNRQQLLNGFQFQDDFVLHDWIDLVATVQLQALVIRRADPLAAESSIPDGETRGTDTPHKLTPRARGQGAD